jgi:predicted protein tyrosine phosphatase
MMHVLFICSRNKWRSPTAEQIFSDYPGIETSSAGLSDDARNSLTPEQIKWADIIFVMEQKHKSKLYKQFHVLLSDVRVICLEIPDDYGFMDSKLVELLKSKITNFLPANSQ